MKKLKVAIIGAGAAGIMAACVSGKRRIFVDLYDKNSRIGKKLLVSGNGRCNISNKTVTKNDYYGEDVYFAESVIKRFDFYKFDRFCRKIGLILDVKEDGRAYPVSNEAKSVVSVFEACLNSSGVNVFLNTPVSDIERHGDKFFVFKESELLGEYDKVLITSGLLAAPQIGGSQDGVLFASKFGHSFNEPYPSLVPLELEGKLFKYMEGVKHTALVSLYVDKKRIMSVEGDILFTKYGISGFAVLDISTEASFFLLKNRYVEISVNLFPSFDRRHIRKHLEAFAKNLNGYTALDILSGILPLKIAKTVLKKLGIDRDSKAYFLTAKSIEDIVKELFDMRFCVKAAHGFEYAEVCGGGIKTKEIDKRTMESKLINGLYFAGEVLDIVGKRGGYNLAFSFASGYIAGVNL